MRIFIPASNKARSGRAAQGFGVHPGGGSIASGAGASRSTEHGFRSSSRSTEHGFTLLEMLVALAIFSLAGLALVRLQAVSVRTAADLDTRIVTQITARNIAFERQTDPNPPASGESEESITNAGRDLHWKQQVAPTGDGRLLQVTVIVNGGVGQSPAVVSMVRPAL